MTARHDLDQQLNAFLRDGPDELPNESFDAVRDRTEQTRQRVVLGPWRLPEMNKLIAVGLGAVAVVAVLLVGYRLLSPPGNTGGPGGESTPTPVPSVAEPSVADPSVEASTSEFLPEGPFAWVEPANPPVPPDDGPPITVTIPASGWTCLDFGGFCILSKGDEIDNLPESALLWESTMAGFLVYGDPCQWQDSTPDTPATTADEIVAALAAQPSRNASDPVDVTVGGYTGKSITLHVPDPMPADCDGEEFASYAFDGFDAGNPRRWHQGPGQIDEFWVLDVDGAIVVIDATYRPDTPTERIEEMRDIVESATFD